MFLRIFNAVLLAAVLAACSPESSTSAAAGEGPSGASAASSKVPCALAGAKSYTAECVLERDSRDGKVLVTLRHPDGGFRRLIELDHGKRFAAADGSDEVAIAANGKEIEVTLGDDHYLFPAPGVTSAPKP